MMYDNKAIRWRAGEVYRQNWLKLSGVLLVAMGAPILLTFAAMTPALFGYPEMGIIGLLLSAVFVLLWYPIILLGGCRVGLHCWRGQKASLADLFYYVSNFERAKWAYGRTLLLLVLYMGGCMAVGTGMATVTFAATLLSIPLMVLGGLGSVIAGVVMLVLFLAVYVIILWFVVRFCPVFVVMVQDERCWPIEALRISWQITKGHTWRIMRMFLLVSLCMMLILLAVIIPVAWISLMSVYFFAPLIIFPVAMLTYIVTGAYLLLVYCGLCDELLPQHPPAAPSPAAPPPVVPPIA